jgi:hypothetical protein
VQRLAEVLVHCRRRAAGLAATDTLTTGFVVHLVVLLVGSLRSGALHNAHDRCLLRITDAAVTRAWPLFTLLDLSALVSGAASVWCYTLAAGRLFAGLLGTSLVAYWVLSSRWLKVHPCFRAYYFVELLSVNPVISLFRFFSSQAGYSRPMAKVFFFYKTNGAV